MFTKLCQDGFPDACERVTDENGIVFMCMYLIEMAIDGKDARFTYPAGLYLFSSCRILLDKLSHVRTARGRNKAGMGGDSVIFRFTKGGSYMTEIFRPTHGFSDVQPIRTACRVLQAVFFTIILRLLVFGGLK